MELVIWLGLVLSPLTLALTRIPFVSGASKPEDLLIIAMLGAFGYVLIGYATLVVGNAGAMIGIALWGQIRQRHRNLSRRLHRDIHRNHFRCHFRWDLWGHHRWQVQHRHRCHIWWHCRRYYHRPRRQSVENTDSPSESDVLVRRIRLHIWTNRVGHWESVCYRDIYGSQSARFRSVQFFC